MSAQHSQFLKLIENIFSVFEVNLKHRLSPVQSRLDDRETALAAGHSGLITWRSTITEDLARQAVPAVTKEKVCAAYRHANTYFGDCLAREDFMAE